MLSPAENQVLEQVKRGLSNLQVAERLSITEKTVKFHLTSIYKKLNVKTRAELIVKEQSTMPSGGYMKEVSPRPEQGKLATAVPAKSQEDKIMFIDEKFKVGSTIGHLHKMMTEVTKEEINPSTVNAACNCVARLNETINTAIQAARFLNER